MKNILIPLLIILFTTPCIPQESFQEEMKGSFNCSYRKSMLPHRKIVTSDAEIQHSFNVLNYKLNLDIYNCFLSPYPASFTADEIVTVRADSIISNISLDAVSSSLIINSVGLSGTGFTHTDDILIINLDRTYSPGETLSVSIRYSHNNVDDEAFYTGGGFVFTDCEPQGARRWFPCLDKPSDKATVDITAKVPASVKLGSNGRLADSVKVADTIYYNWISRDPVATYLVVLTGKVNYNLDIVYWRNTADPPAYIPFRFYYNDGENPQAMMRDIMAMARLFSDIFCEYPFEKNGFATLNQQFQWGGMENQTLTSLCPNCWNEMLIVHEFAHQWFGDMITCATWADLWLNEGFASYSEALWYESSGSYDSYKWLITEYATDYLNGNPGWAISNPGWADNPPADNILFNYQITYQKSACILHLLRYVAGDQKFFEILNAYADDPLLKYNSAVTSDFKNIVSNVTGEDYSWFFDQWIYQPNHPVYANQYFIREQSQGIWEVGFYAVQTQTNAGFFKMPIEIKAGFTDGSDTLLHVMNDQNNQFFSFIFEKEPASIQFDPSNQIVLKKQSLIRIDPSSAEENEAKPEGYFLSRNYPNPFNPSTRILVSLPENSNLKLTVYNLVGEVIKIISEGYFSAGDYSFEFNGNSDGGGFPSGIYIYELKTDKAVLRNKMILQK